MRFLLLCLCLTPVLRAQPPAQPPKIVRPNPVPRGIILVKGDRQEVEGRKYRLRGNAEVETPDLLLTAEEIDYDEETGLAEARGRVRFVNFTTGEELQASRVDYDMKNSTGTFYTVYGTAFGKIDERPGILRTSNPFVFQGDWAEKFKDRYILYNGSLTNCDPKNPWWTLTGPKFDIIPNQRALVYKSFFRMKGVPVLYAPVFYKSLKAEDRRSGFLTPNFGSSNRRGLMFGVGYFYAINRSYDVMYRPQYFTQRGFAHTVDVRGKPTHNSEFSTYIYGVNDKGLLLEDGTRRYEGGWMLTASGRAELRGGFYAKALINYLSNFKFRQAFTESFNEAVFSEVNSIAHLSKDWSTYHFNAVFSEQQNFQSDRPGDKISIRRMPQVEFISRDRELVGGPLPVWTSWNTSLGLVRRNQPAFETRKFVERLDGEPRVMTALRWKEFHLIPSLSARGTYYGSSFQDGQVAGTNVTRLSHNLTADLIFPTLERVFTPPRWVGRQAKHSIEPRVTYRYVGGVDNFQNIIRFDDMEIISNTNEVEYAVANRLWTKTRAGEVRDWLTLDVRQKRFFDPSFGGAVVAGRRNVITSTADLTGYTFLEAPRRDSPIVSMLRLTPRPAFGVEWRTDYDQMRGKFVNSSLTADARFTSYMVSIGHNKVSCVSLAQPVDPALNPCQGGVAQPGTVLSPPSNQLRAMVGVGQENKRGWNAGFLAIYDYSTATMQFANTQVTYNTACCAFSGQYRRFAFGTRNENQYRFALVIANIGSFGTLRRQERLF